MRCDVINHDSIIVFQLSIVPLKENLKFNLYSFNIYHFKVFKLQWHMAILSECFRLDYSTENVNSKYLSVENLGSLLLESLIDSPS